MLHVLDLLLEDSMSDRRDDSKNLEAADCCKRTVTQRHTEPKGENDKTIFSPRKVHDKTTKKDKALSMYPRD